MEDRKEGGGGGGWLSVPAFGDWEQKHGGVPDYSMDFSKIREMRKQNKKDISRLSVGNDDELINPTSTKDGAANHHIVGRARDAAPGAGRVPGPHHRRSHSGSLTTKEKIMRYLNCCVTA
uniref:Pyridoxal biosynthesis lyase pdxS n=1 Tax=Anthurium amnicola TaxID=1678845 RepID=A0A1D1YW02_9ARAE